MTAVASGGAPATAVESLAPPEREAYAAAADEHRLVATHLLESERPAASAPWMPSTIAVGGVVDYSRCPKRFYWSYVRPLQRFSGPAERIGTEFHRLIEN